MKFFHLLLNIDRRIIFVFIAIAVCLPFFIKVNIEKYIYTTEPVYDTYSFIDNLTSDDCILISFDFDPASIPELYPMATSIIRQCFTKKIKVLTMALWPDGAAIAEELVSSLAEEFGAKEGEDYCNLGWKAGGSVVILGLGDDIVKIFPQNYSKTRSTSDMPIFKKVKNYSNIALVVDLAAGDTPLWWIIYAHTPYKQKVASGVTAVMAADFYPYLHTHQLIGLLNGLKGASEYEKLIERPAVATKWMIPQSAIHLVIIMFIVIGNVGYFITLKRRG